jgi:uncharacterized peroxidase-related enzyme
MARLRAVNPTTDTGRGAEILNGPLKAKQINIFKSVAANPGVLEAFLAFAGGVKSGKLTPAEHEIIALTVAQHNDCDYCLAAHTQLAKGAGIDEDRALRIRQGGADDDRHQTIIDFTQAILDSKGNVTDRQLEAFRNAGFDDAAVIEVVGAIAVNEFTNTFNRLNRTEVDFPVAAAV